MEYIPVQDETKSDDDEIFERYKKWIDDGKPGMTYEERLANIDISRELEMLGLTEEG